MRAHIAYKHIVIALSVLFALHAVAFQPSMITGRRAYHTSLKMRYINGISEIINDYDTFILDMWGVMHNGSEAYPGVLDLMKKLSGKRLVILSNSSKRYQDSVKMLNKLGFDESSFAQIITSGEVAYQMLSREASSENTSKNYDVKWDKLQEIIDKGERKAFVLGSGSDDKGYVESCGWEVTSLEDAQLIIARGTFTINDGTEVVDKDKDAALYEDILAVVLETAAALKLPMLVCNPDKIRPDAKRSPMPGKIGTDYIAALGDDDDDADLVKFIGKPVDDIYKYVMKDSPASRFCMIGDALETDVTGGSLTGIDTIWVLRDGVHSPDVSDSLDGKVLLKDAQNILDKFNSQSDTYAKGRQLSPTMIMPHFRWQTSDKESIS